MGLSLDHLESIVWPKYKGPARSLCQEIWALANPKQAAVPSPEWFNEIVEMQIKSMLMLVFSSPQAWVIFPEPLPGYTTVVYKKPRGAVTESSQQRLSLRHHSLDQFSDMAKLVEKAAVKLMRTAVSASSGDVVELENEDAHVFVFPRPKMHEYLKALGFSDDQVPRLINVDDIQGDF